MYVRKTKDVYEVQGNYGYGWDFLTEEETAKEARAQKRCYDENEPYPHRIVKRRVRIEANGGKEETHQ